MFCFFLISQRSDENLVFFCDLCFYVTVQMFRLLDYVILLHATVLSMILKGLVKFISGWQDLYLRKTDVCIHNKNKYLNGILNYFKLFEDTLCTYPSQ